MTAATQPPDAARPPLTRTGERPGPAGPGFGGRLMAPLLLGSALNPLNSTAIATGLVTIGHAFGTGAAGTAWLVSALYVASAVGQPVTGRLADTLGPRRVLLAGLTLVCAAGLLGTLAPAFGWLVAARALLGLGTSAAYPSAMAMLRAEAARVGREAPRPVLGRLSFASLGSAAAGPALGGLLIATAGWRGLFAFNVPLALAGIVLALRWLPADPVRPKAADGRRERFADPLGLALFAAALTATALFLTDLAHPLWPLPPLIALLTAVLVRWEARHPRPFLDLRSLRGNGALARTYLRHGLAYLTIYCVLYGFTQWLEDAHGYSVLQVGLIMLPMSGAAAVLSLLGARTKGLRAPLVTAAALLTAGATALLFTTGTTPLLALPAVAVLFGISQGLTSTGNQGAVYAQAPADGVGAAAGLQRTSQYLGAMIAAGLIGLSYGPAATDRGLRELATVGMALGLVLLVLTAADRALRARPRSSARSGTGP
ncbi:MFS transporter [Streptomyces eurocidicus]|uniref:MFS family permease n=2 Tax=Streptomyces eurocidicus TaxID=66423 RepID=A0A2N8NVD5_STREU|nr:MFS transporter [Streptomyces eurocidicus]MBB5122619.1 MFS family permease [Streptomyces eurocidicus]PNE32699.1 MFS transporter [Streptomyces eurocidicus]